MALAQDSAVPSGPVMTFGINERLEVSGQPFGDTLISNTQFSFGLHDETARMVFDLNANAGLRITNGANSDTGLADPRIALAYSRLGATAQLDLNAGFRRTDIAFLRSLDEFTDENGVITLPPDFGNLRGSGIQQNLNFDAKLSLRQDAPFGLVLATGITDLNYTDVTDSDLVDSQRSYVGVTARLDLSPVTQATVGLRYSLYEDASVTRGTLGLNSDLTITRPDGALRIRLGVDETPEGARISLGAGRDFERPNGALSFNLGAVETAGGGISLTGNLDLRQDYAKGTATASFSQNIASGSNDAEELQTTLNLGLTRELTTLASLNLGLAYATSTDTATDATVNSANASASLSYALSADWAVDLGYRYQFQEQDGGSETSENVLFLGLRRAFELPL